MPDGIIWLFACFLGNCLLQGVSFAWEAFGRVDLACCCITGVLYWSRKHQKYWELWEGIVRKYAALIILVQLLFGICFVAPFVQLRDEQIKNQKKGIEVAILQAKLNDKSPKLNGFINRIMIADEMGTTNSLIFLEATIGNSGGSPSIADEYGLKVILSKTTSTNADTIDFSDDYKMNFWDNGKLYLLDLKRAQLISEKTTNTIQPGESPRGWIAFRLPGIPMSRYQSTNIILSFLDINDNRILVTNEFKRGKTGKEKYGVDAISMVLPGSDNIFSVVEPKIETNSGWMPPELPPGCSNVVIYLGASPLVYSRFMAEISSETGTKFAIKDVPDAFLSGYEDSEYYSPRQPDMWLKYWTAMTIGGKTFQYPVQPIIISNRLFVEVEIPFSNEKHKLVMSDSFDPELPIPRRWDRNFSTNYYANGIVSGGVYAYEVVNELTNPVLQVVYAAPNVVLINGIFQVDSNSILAAFGQQPQLLTFQINGQNPTQGVMTASLQSENFHETLIINSNETVASFGQRLTNELFRPIFKYQKPIFKYPSNRHLGVLGDWEMETNKSDSKTELGL
jgi:hypothetical protein